MSDYKPKTYEEFCVLKSIEEKESLMVLEHNAERRSMERLTKRNEANTAYYYPKCFEKCDGLGASEKCNNCDLVHDACEKLGEYEDLEEQGLLLKLPCKVGDTVYAICTCKDVETVLDGTMYGQNGGFGTATGYYCPYELNDKCPHTETDDCEECKNIENVFEDTIDYINIEEYGIMIGLKNTNLCANIYDIGETVFLTQEQAEEALKKMRETEE